MFRNAVVFLVGFFFFMSNATARPCVDSDDNSCWTAKNYSRQTVDLNCTTTSWTLISIHSLAPGGLDSVQLDTGYGDGMGFPEPGVLVTCQAKLSSGEQAKLSFSSYGWGDRVEIRVEKNLLRATSTEYWLTRTVHTSTAQFNSNGT
jgi:hypothetical protein